MCCSPNREAVRAATHYHTRAWQTLIVHGHVYSRGIFLKKANHYDNFNCNTLGNAKTVVGTSNNLAEPDDDVIKMATILNFNTNLLCFIISIIVGRFKFFRYQNVQNDKCCLLTSKKND